ncbi:MAG: tetratricopeptide repeat protein [Alphaproteobacteria bacterium]|nr:tetratricopeptide repeat protein [Alphaproteobacteria bacterium]
MKHFFAWLATAATLTFTLPAMPSQTDPGLDRLFDALRQASDESDAQAIEQAIWRRWIVSGNVFVDQFVALGLEAMAANAFGDALKVFDEVVKMAPDFAEGWNRRATVHYLLGNYDASAADIAETLAREPRHFGALSGLGLVELGRGREAEALAAFERALAVHPHLPGAKARIQLLREKLRGRGI